jgi:hypothetical protein
VRAGPRVALGIALLADVLGDHAVVVSLEAPVEAEAAVEYPRGHEGRGLVPALREHGRQCRNVRSQTADAVVADAVRERVESGHERAVRG